MLIGQIQAAKPLKIFEDGFAWLESVRIKSATVKVDWVRMVSSEAIAEAAG